MKLLPSPAVVFILFAAIYTLTLSGHLYSPDEELMFRVTEAMATRGEVSIEPLHGGSGDGFASRPGRNGREYAQYGLGNSVAALPLYGISQILTHMIPAQTAEDMLDFQTILYAPPGPGYGHALLKRFIVSFMGVIVGAAIIAVLFHFIRTRLPAYSPSIDQDAATRAAWIVSLAAGLGTMVWPHSRTFFAEPLATLCILLSFLAATGGATLTLRRSFLTGFCLALALFTRLDSIVAVPPVFLLLLLRIHCRPLADEHDSRPIQMSQLLATALSRTFVTASLVAAIPLIAFVVYQFTLNRILFGGALQSGYADQSEGIRFSTPLLAGLYGYFFSAGKSMLLFSPILFLVIFTMRHLWRSVPILAIPSAALLILLLLFHSKWQNWSGGWDWGPRHIYMLHPFACMFLAGWALRWSILKRRLFFLIMLIAGGVQFYGTSQNPVDYYMLYYRTPYEPPNAFALFSPNDMAPQVMRVQILGQDGQWRSAPQFGVMAPLNDTIYVPQNSQWYGYADMWSRGYTDNLWLRLMQRTRGREQPVQF